MAGATLFLITDGPAPGTPTLSAYALSGFAYAPGTAQTRSGVICTPVGGVAPFTYVWSSVTANGTYANTPTSAGTFFSYAGYTPTVVTDQFICTVTDANANVTVSPPISITLELRSTSGGGTIP